jgi:hypothetical protein
MKKLLIIISLIGVLLSCDNEGEKIIFDGTPFIFFESGSKLSILENSTEVLEIPLKISLAQSKDVTIQLQITSSTAVVNSDFEILTPDVLTIKAGEYETDFKIRVIDNDVSESERRMINVKIVSVSDGLDVQVLKEIEIEILNDDCPFDFSTLSGDYEVEFTNEAGFLWDAGVVCCAETTLRVGESPFTLVDPNFYGLTGAFDVVNDAVTISFSEDGSSVLLNPDNQLAYVNASGASRFYQQDAELGPGTVVATCNPIFTVNILIIRNTGTLAEIATLKYTKKQ